jgi:hypothetical protein
VTPEYTTTGPTSRASKPGPAPQSETGVPGHALGRVDVQSAHEPNAELVRQAAKRLRDQWRQGRPA